MDIYGVVGAILAAFCVGMFTEGRLEPGTPDWLMRLYLQALSGGLIYLVAAVWLSMHASVAAQSYKVRILTQLVRLPIPTTAQLNGARTWAQSVEQVSWTKLFRIPLLHRLLRDPRRQAAMGSVAPGRQDELEAEATAEFRESGDGQDDFAEATVEDPWGLEDSRTKESYELDTDEQFHNLRHIKLVREAQQYYQAHDAFARVCMSMGMVQCCMGICYYTTGYALIEDGAPWAAYASNTILLTLACILVSLDVVMDRNETLAARILLCTGPVVSLVAATTWGQYTKAGSLICWMLLPVVFFAQAGWLAMSLYLAKVDRCSDGQALPTKFRSVLYLDVFGWLRGSGRAFQRRAPGGFWEHQSLFVQQQEFEIQESMSPGARSRLVSNDISPGQETRASGSGTPRYARPLAGEATQAISEVAHEVVEALQDEDMDDTYESVREREPLQGVGRRSVPDAASNAFAGSSFYPHPTDHTIEVEDEELLPDIEDKDSKNWRGTMPWRVFKGLTLVLLALEIHGGCWCLGRLMGTPDLMDSPLPAVEDRLFGQAAEASAKEGELAAGRPLGQTQYYQRSTALRQRLHELQQNRSRTLQGGRRLAVKWPRKFFTPRALSCRGGVVLASDEFSLVRARRSSEDAVLVFEKEDCPELFGVSVRDSALTCSNGTCEAVALHGPGQRLTRCGSGTDHVSAGGDWLDDDEVLTGLSLPPAASAGALDGATVVTSGGKTVMMQVSSEALIPKQLVHRTAPQTGPRRKHRLERVGDRHVVLFNGGLLRVLDSGSGEILGDWMLPDLSHWQNLCVDEGVILAVGHSSGDNPLSSVYQFSLASLLERGK
mmetsp:Transcript_43084/g.91477  ORF Transcript_43084/g.91477 Transcript_43084/m.91477 type:complete len:832 (+) Transcript_43084:1-2496(+)